MNHFRLLALLLTIVLGLVLDVSGALHVYGLAALMGQRLALASALLLVAVAVGWLLVAAAVRHPSPDEAPPSLLAAPIRQRVLVLLVLLAWLATARSYVVFLAPPPTLSALVLLAGVALALLAALVLRMPPGAVALLALVAGAGVRLASYAQVPIEPEQGDMLPLVQGALANLLAGNSPYTMYAMPWEVPLTYPPATWLAYLPPYLAGLDIRLTNLAAEVGIGAALVWLAVVGTAPQAGSMRGALAAVWRSEETLLVWAWVFVQPGIINWSLSTTAPVWWALVALALVLVLAGRCWLAALALGVGAAASSLAALVVPFVLLAWLRRYGARQTALLALVAGGVAAALILPFLLWAPQQFVFGVLQWFNNNDIYPRLRWEMDHTWARQTGFSGIFWRRGLEGLLKPIQAGLLAGLLALFWWWGAQARQLAPLVCAAGLLFMVFNPVLWPYLYHPALVAALVALVALARPPVA